MKDIPNQDQQPEDWQQHVFILPYPPSVNHYKHYVCSVNHSHTIRSYVSQKTKDFKEEAGWILRGVYKGDTEKRAVSVTVHAYHSSAFRQRDLDNVCKVLMDSMQGIIYENDSQVKELHLYAHESTKSEARIEVRITVL